MPGPVASLPKGRNYHNGSLKGTGVTIVYEKYNMVKKNWFLWYIYHCVSSMDDVCNGEDLSKFVGAIL